MIGALLLSFALLGQHSETTDPMLAEVRSLSAKVEARLERLETKVDAVHDGMVTLKAAVLGKNQLIDEDHVTLTHPATGLVVRATRSESAIALHRWFFVAVGGIITTIVGGVGVARWKKRLGLNGKNGNGRRARLREADV